MKTSKRTHIVDDKGLLKLPVIPVALCGVRLLEAMTYIAMLACEDNDVDELWKLRKRSRLYSLTDERPFVTIYEFIYDGDDSPDCSRYRAKLQKILDEEDTP